MGIWTWRVVSYTLTHLSLRGKSSLKCNLFYCKNIFFSLWAKHGHSEKRKCRPVMMMKEKKERKKMLEKKIFFVYSGLGTSRAYIHVTLVLLSKLFYTAAFGLFHFGPFVSIYFFSLIHLCIQFFLNKRRLPNFKFLNFSCKSFFKVDLATLIGERKRLTLKLPKFN